MSRRKYLIGLGIVVLSALGLAGAAYRNSRLEAGFHEVLTGQSKEAVAHLMGKPSWIEPCGKSLGTPKLNCIQYVYRNSFAPFDPQYFSIMFDDTGHVQDKGNYVSP
jgi:hypothetical protein